ncbi:MAG: BON domain-containing protein [Candidatus Eremiobacteraeota bacterium]|nr:BON domain-containing protein [Candidatus Eremiobacteraeota bacterium]
MMRGAIAIAVLAVLTACSKSDVDSTQNAVASAVPKLANVAGIAARIEARFVQIDPSSALHVSIAVNGGDVRLGGKVRTEDIGKRFVAQANGVTGVTHVSSTIAIDASLPNAKDSIADYALEGKIRAKLVEQAGVNGLSIVVTARGGAVTLAGNVSSKDVADTLTATAKTVNGVKAVESKLVVRE